MTNTANEKKRMTTEEMAEALFNDYRKLTGSRTPGGEHLPEWHYYRLIQDNLVQSSVGAVRKIAEGMMERNDEIADRNTRQWLMEEVGDSGMKMIIESDLNAMDLKGGDPHKPYHDIFRLSDDLESLQVLGAASPEASADYSQVPDDMLAAVLAVGATALTIARRVERARAEGGAA